MSKKASMAGKSRIGELAGHKIPLWIFFQMLMRHSDGSVGALRGTGDYHLLAEAYVLPRFFQDALAECCLCDSKTQYRPLPACVAA